MRGEGKAKGEAITTREAARQSHARTSAVIGGRYRAFFGGAIAAVLLLQVTIITDTIIVGQLLGPVPMSGVRVASPIVNILNVLAMLVGVGGSTLVSIAMGKRETDRANSAFTLSIVLALLFGAVFALIVAPSADLVAALISSEENTVVHTATFLRIVTAASPVYILASVMALLLRADSCIKLSSAVLAIAGVANVGFDLLFMGALGMGVEGSAFATDAGMLVAVLLSLAYFRWPLRTLRLRNVRHVIDRDLFAGVIKNGTPSALRMLLACIALLFLNYVVGGAVGVEGIAFLTVCGNVQLLAMAFFSAGGQAAIPIEGVLFGERDFGGLRLLMGYVLRVIVACVGVLVLVIWLFPGQIVELFVPGGIEGSDWLMRLYAVGYFPLAINYVLTYYYNTIQRRKIAMVITLCENLVLYLPLIWILTTAFGLVGAVLSFVCAEFLALALALAIASLARRKEGFDSVLLVPATPCEVVLETTVPATDVAAAGIAHSVKEALDACGVDASVSMRAAIGAEEVVANAAALEQNRGHHVLFDVIVSDLESCVQISLRDNGASFDPLTCDESGEDGNIAVMRAVVSDVCYRFMLGMNQTIIKVNHSPQAGALPG